LGPGFAWSDSYHTKWFQLCERAKLRGACSDSAWAAIDSAPRMIAFQARVFEKSSPPVIDLTLRWALH
jgi:hypothetical protein